MIFIYKNLKIMEIKMYSVTLDQNILTNSFLVN